MSIIVSAYYKIPSKQSHDFYFKNMMYYFDLLASHKKVFFCEEDVKRELQSRYNTINTTFIIKPFSELSILKTFPYSLWKEQLENDPEKYHTPELGIIWASKKEFVREALELNPSTQWACWVDAGAIRNYNWKPFTNKFLKRVNFNTLEQGIYIQNIKPFVEKEIYVFPDCYIAGALILCHRNYINHFSTLYNNIIERYIENKIAISSDQYIMASMSSIYKPSWLKLVYDEDTWKSCPDIWFFFLAKW